MRLRLRLPLPLPLLLPLALPHTDLVVASLSPSIPCVLLQLFLFSSLVYSVLSMYIGRANMDFSLRRHAKRSRVSEDVNKLDMLTSLPDEVLSHILTLIPTKDAAAASLASKKMWRAFCWRTSLDFDDSPISHCLQTPHLMDRFETFKTFVNAVLKAFESPYLSKFRLRLGGDMNSCRFYSCKRRNDYGERVVECLPGCEPLHLSSWIHFPLARDGIREIDLCFHVKQHVQLPPALFTCETLEVLKIDASLDFDQVSDISLPNLKTFHLGSVLLTDDSFLTKLVSCCSFLEDLTVKKCWWKHGEYISISSTSLQKLVLYILRPNEDDLNHSKRVLINAPNLRYLFYSDNLARQYSIISTNALAEAHIKLQGFFEYDPLCEVVSFQSLLSLIRLLPNVTRLGLTEHCVEVLDFGELNDQLQVFHNLKHLELGCERETRWDKVLPAFLKWLPFLETLTFSEGLSLSTTPSLREQEWCDESLRLERAACATMAQVMGHNNHLKRIELHEYWGFDREDNWIQYFLRYAAVLEEFVINETPFLPESLERSLKLLPKASSNCSIQVLKQIPAPDFFPHNNGYNHINHLLLKQHGYQ